MEMMSAVSWPSEGTAIQRAGTQGAGTQGAGPQRQRSVGRVELLAAASAAGTHLSGLAESGALRARLPRVEGGGLEAVLVNTAGGVACGDAFHMSITAKSGARVTVATPAAEKVYRSDGPVSHISVKLEAEAGATLHWLPQETILFDTARLARTYEVDLAEDARFLSFEGLMLGRAARGETVREGHLSDRWRVRRAGKLIYADALRLSGPIADLIARPAVAAGGVALGTCLYVAPDAQARLEEARGLLETCACECGASAWNGLLVARFIGRDIETLRRDATSFLMGFTGSPLPRVWGL